MKETKPKILFNEKSLPFIFRVFGLTVNQYDFITDVNTGRSVLTAEGDILTKQNFGGIKKGVDGSIIFLKNDLLTCIKISEGSY